MKPMFTIHEGEFLVGDHITRKLSKRYEVWVPAKDNGVDLLVTPSKGVASPVKLQVKFSRGFEPKRVPAEKLRGWGWYTINPAKVHCSKADLRVFVILTLQHRQSFIVVPTADLKERIPKKLSGVQHLYLAALRDRRCYDMRNLSKNEILDLIDRNAECPERDYSRYLENWALLERPECGSKG